MGLLHPAGSLLKDDMAPLLAGFGDRDKLLASLGVDIFSIEVRSISLARSRTQPR